MTRIVCLLVLGLWACAESGPKEALAAPELSPGKCDQPGSAAGAVAGPLASLQSPPSNPNTPNTITGTITNTPNTITITTTTPPSAPPVPPVPTPPAAASVPPTPPKEEPMKQAQGEAPVRPATLAGSWYDGNPDSLRATIDQWLRAAPPMPEGMYPLGLIAPHAGHQYSGKVAAAAYATLRGRSYARVFLLAPSHRRPFQGLALGDYSAFQTPLGAIPVDRAELAALATLPLAFRDRDAHEAEHSLEIHLPFLQRALDGFAWKLVPIMVGQLTPDELAQTAAFLATRVGPGDLVVASSDFTHYGRNYGYQGPEGQQFAPDQAPEKLQLLLDQAYGFLRDLDHQGLRQHLESTGDTVCGAKPIELMLAMMPKETRAQRLAADTSGQLTGDFSSSVSYMSVLFSGLWPYNGAGGTLTLTAQEKQTLLKIARGTLDTWVKTRKKPSFEELGVQVEGRLMQPQGVFVTLKMNDDLRGCIGTIPPLRPLAEAVRDNAINASTHDPRFPQVTPAELPALEVEVSVLGIPAPVASPRDIVLARDGVLLNKAGRGAVFLPQVAPEQGWTLDMTLSALSRKAGLPLTAWQSGADLQVFQALVFHEE